jgi:hypothetical protein
MIQLRYVHELNLDPQPQDTFEFDCVTNLVLKLVCRTVVTRALVFYTRKWVFVKSLFT